MAAPRHHRGAELHDDHRRAAPRASPPGGRLHVARALELPGRERRRVEGDQGAREQVEKLGGDVEALARPDRDALPQGEVFAKPIAFNVVAKVGEFEADGFTGEESKMMAEPRKILDAPEMRVVATSVRVPVVAGHAVSMLAEFSRPISVGEARELLKAAPGVRLMDDLATGTFPSPLDAAGGDDALVGRIRQVPGRDDALALFSCADNLRKGAALDAIQIAEHLFIR